MTETDDFVVYLDRRTSHTKAKLDKVANYKKMDLTKLNDQQLATIQLELETQGKMLEIASVREQYERYAEKRGKQVETSVKESYEKGKKDALSDLKGSFAVVSDYLLLMSQIYKSGTPVESSKNIQGLYKLLEMLYAGGEQGGEAIARLVLGSTELVEGTSLSFADVKHKLETQSVGNQNQNGATQLSEQTDKESHKNTQGTKDTKDTKEPKGLKEQSKEKKDQKDQSKEQKESDKSEDTDENGYIQVGRKNNNNTNNGNAKKNGHKKRSPKSEGSK